MGIEWGLEKCSLHREDASIQVVRQEASKESGFDILHDLGSHFPNSGRVITVVMRRVVTILNTTCDKRED